MSWDRDSAALGTFYRFLNDNGSVAHRPWRSSGKSTALGSGISRDLRVRHMELVQYPFLRDVGFGGLTPDAVLDESFGGWCPHRNRETSEPALMTGMRIQEWSTLLLPELGLEDGRCPPATEVDLAECAKCNRPRTVYVPRDVIELLDSAGVAGAGRQHPGAALHTQALTADSAPFADADLGGAADAGLSYFQGVSAARFPPPSSEGLPPGPC